MYDVECINIVTLLGIRFWDSVPDRAVTDELVVEAYPETGSGPVVTAFRTASGVYAFRGLPGMMDYENKIVETFDDEGDQETSPSSPAVKRGFDIRVTDNLRRFLPVVFNVRLPLSYRGLYLSGNRAGLDVSPPLTGTPPGFYLFSSATRNAAPGTAVVRGQLLDGTTGKPAAYALMKVQLADEEETEWQGIADENGAIAVLFPYPTTTAVPLNLSPISESVPLVEQQWQLKVRVWYEPGALTYPVNMDIPYLSSIKSQLPGTICGDSPGSPSVDSYVEELPAVLTYGEELILKTGGTGKSELWIEAGISSP